MSNSADVVHSASLGFEDIWCKKTPRDIIWFDETHEQENSGKDIRQFLPLKLNEVYGNCDVMFSHLSNRESVYSHNVKMFEVL